MNADRLLAASEAEAVVEERIEQFGLGALPRVRVSEMTRGTWRVRWGYHDCIVAAMTAEAWRAWLEDKVGSLEPGMLQTTES